MYDALIFLETMYTVCKKRIRISWKKDRQICLYKSYKFKNRFYTENSKSKQKINSGNIYCQDFKLTYTFFYSPKSSQTCINRKLIVI